MMSEIETVKIRKDLIVSEQRDADKVYAIIKDPKTQGLFRMEGPTYLVFRELSAGASLEATRQMLLAEYGVTMSEDKLGAFVQDLREKRLVEGTADTLKKKRISFSSLVHLRIKLRLVDPDAFLDRLARILGFFFTPFFAFFSIALVVTGFVVTFLHWNAIIAGLNAGISEFILLVWGMQVLAIGVHELAHGVACKHFGGRVNEMGVMLIALVLPCLYCNLNDIRLFDSRKKRLIVLLAGVYSGLILCGIGAIGWLFAPEGSVWKLFAAGLIINAGLLSLFNLNPFIPLDGYYVLSELLGIENLRVKSLEFFMGALILRHPVRVKNDPTRAKIIYVIYAIFTLTQGIAMLVLGVGGLVVLIASYF